MKHNAVKTLKSKQNIEKNKSIKNNTFRVALLISACSALFFSILIIIYVALSGLFGFNKLGFFEILFGGKYDGVTLFASGFMVINTLWTSIIAATITIPISVITALFITRVAPKKLKTLFFISLSILAAIPSVIYGAFGAKILDGITMTLFGTLSGSLATIVITLSFMMMPTITLITATSINSVDKKLEYSSLALGATKNQTSFKVTLRAASTGILTGVILGIGRSLGEATAVSMISVDPYTGPTFGLFVQIRLLTATMLKGYSELEPGSLQQASMFSMGLLLIITILIVFLSLRYLKKINNPEQKAKRDNKKLTKIKKLKNDVLQFGFAELSIEDQKIYRKHHEKEEVQYGVDKHYHAQYRIEKLLSKTTIKVNNEKQKERTSNALSALTWITSSIGVLFLISIIMFLLFGGINTLSWNLITSSGQIKIDEIYVNGLQPAIFGTLLMIGLSLVLIIPLGVGTGLYFSIFAPKDGKLTKLLLTGIDVLSGIPSLIFGLVGAVIFLPLARLINFTPMAGAIILTLIVTPTIVQTTQEAINNVPAKMIDGSLALGSTKTISSLRISLPQALPQIISGIILSIGRIIGESAAIVMIFGTVSRGSFGDWTSFGGTTLATEIYALTLLEEIPWNVVTAIGIVIIFLILLLALLANNIAEKKWLSTAGIGISLLMIVSSVLTAIGLLMIIGFIILIISVIVEWYLTQ